MHMQVQSIGEVTLWACKKAPLRICFISSTISFLDSADLVARAFTHGVILLTLSTLV